MVANRMPQNCTLYFCVMGILPQFLKSLKRERNRVLRATDLYPTSSHHQDFRISHSFVKARATLTCLHPQWTLTPLTTDLDVIPTVHGLGSVGTRRLGHGFDC